MGGRYRDTYLPSSICASPNHLIAFDYRSPSSNLTMSNRNIAINEAQRANRVVTNFLSGQVIASSDRLLNHGERDVASWR